ncbi:hypothetical protein BGZ97_000763 [Linnemannia gamsii]|uniref:Uncharacterized protein n=1 Tax=Linnemannia gamsii TaxID=64522 RepID=A0A9P6UIT3_9FUNG|nr:hypothetical protein BGZ97_000763 [Linnemannia gamsii]
MQHSPTVRLPGHSPIHTALGHILYIGVWKQRSKDNVTTAAGLLFASDAATIAYGFSVEVTAAVPTQTSLSLPGTHLTSLTMSPVFATIKNHYTQNSDLERSKNISRIELFFPAQGPPGTA